MTAAGQMMTVADISATAIIITYSSRAITPPALLRHRRSPEVLVEERFVVLLRDEAEQTGHIFRRPGFEGERLLIRLQKRQKDRVAYFFVQRIEKVRSLLIQKAEALAERKRRITFDAVRIRNWRDGGGLFRAGAPLRNETVVDAFAVRYQLLQRQRGGVLGE